MTDIQRKAMELANSEGTYKKALFRAIERHEAFRQEVSDAVQAYSNAYSSDEAAWATLKAFIIPKPKPDPLVEAMKEIGVIPLADNLRAALDALGFEIREKGR